jgi:cytochrome c oxidase cbb3-type subunit 3
MICAAAILLVGGMLLCGACGTPDPPAESADTSGFNSLYASNCSACHGPGGRNGASQSLNDPLYLSIVQEDEIRRTVEHGRPGTSMPAFAQNQGGPLSSAQIDAIVKGIEHSWRGNANLHGAIPPGVTPPGTTPPGTTPPGTTPPPYSAPLGKAQNGKVIFEAVCVLCHGEKGAVGPVTGASYLTLVSDQGLRTTIIVGRPSLGMPDWSHQPYRHGLTDQDISDLVAWLSSQRPRTL